jgi:anthranilate phosphoribosyltransferase
VLIHGHATADDRLTTEAVFQVLGWPIHRERQALTDHQLAYYPLPTLCPSLSRLMDVRRVLGLRNSGHTVAKGLGLGSGPQLRVIAHTHGEFGTLWSQWVERQGLSALLLRGTEGEPVADPRRSPSLHIWLNGMSQTVVPTTRSLTAEFADPEWLGTDLNLVAEWTQDIVLGKRPLPPSVAHQALVLSQLAQSMQATWPNTPELSP